MIDTTNKQKGNCGLGIAIGYFSTNGYTVSIPLNDTRDFVSTDAIDMYLIPVKEIENKSTLNLCEKYNKYKLN